MSKAETGEKFIVSQETRVTTVRKEDEVLSVTGDRLPPGVYQVWETRQLVLLRADSAD